MLAGCSAKTQITITQAALPPPQDKVTLESDWAYVSNDEPGAERILLVFPLPGARAGDRRFFLYIRAPSGQSRRIQVGSPLPSDGQVGGFFIQTTGRLAGKTTFTEGWVTIRKALLSRSGRRTGDIALNCSDGSFIRGRFNAEISPFELNMFEDAKAGDIRSLIKPRSPGQDDTGLGLGPTDAGEPK